ncbi:MAG: coenzyme F390 synthetase [Methanobacteriaceae archaeon]
MNNMKMNNNQFFNSEIETMNRGDLDSLIDEKVKYTVRYANDNSKFYRKWFKNNNITVLDIKTHDDLKELPIISGDVLKRHQPPLKPNFEFKSADSKYITTIHETSGTTGIPKSFFLTKDDWARYIEKYSRAFKAQGLGAGDIFVVCASYGMNIGADSMALAANGLNITTIPEGKCTFPLRVINNYKPTSIVGSIFKFIRLANRMKNEGINPKESSIKCLVAGGESFAEEARKYVEELWGVNVYNTYGSTEGTMCGECSQKNGLHVPEDLIHLDIYSTETDDNPKSRENNDNTCFLDEGKEGKIILTTLLSKGENGKPINSIGTPMPFSGLNSVGERCGTLLINYDTDDISSVLSRARCKCGRTHMRINNPYRDAESAYIFGKKINRVNIEAGVFQKNNMDYLTGEYESIIYGDENENTLRVSMECNNVGDSNKDLIEDNFLKSFLNHDDYLKETYYNGEFEILFNFVEKGELEFYKVKGRPKRLIDRR